MQVDPWHRLPVFSLAVIDMTGERRALYESWVREHAAPLYRCAYRLCGNADAAEDLVQDTFYHAWQSAESLRDPVKARPWLLRILRHRQAHQAREQRRRPRLAPIENADQGAVAPAEPRPSETLEQKESLQGALDTLADYYKLPFLLVYLEGFTCQEASAFLNLPLGTVLSRLHRARQLLRAHLDAADAPPRAGAPAKFRESADGGMSAARGLRGAR